MNRFNKGLVGLTYTAFMGGVINGFVIYPALGAWCLLLGIPFGIANDIFWDWVVRP